MPRPDPELIKVAKVATRLARAGGTPAAQTISRFSEARRSNPRLTAVRHFGFADEGELTSAIGEEEGLPPEIKDASREELVATINDLLPGFSRRFIDMLSDEQLREFVKNLPLLAGDAREARATDAELAPAMEKAGSPPQKFSETFFATYAIKGRQAALGLLPPHRRARCPRL